VEFYGMTSNSLTLVYEVRLSTPVWVIEDADTENNPVFELQLDGRPVSLTLVKDVPGTHISPKRGFRRSPVRGLNIAIELPHRSGFASARERALQHLERILEGPDALALAITNRFVRFFRFSCQTPLLREYELNTFPLPQIDDENGDPIVMAGARQVIDAPKEEMLFDVRQPNPLLDALSQESLDPPVEEEILMEAHEALVENNIRRAVILLAVAAESAARDRIFAGSVTSAALFRYLEEKGRVSLPIPVLISEATKAAFGRSFKADKRADWICLDFLFRARNKAVHRGQTTFRQDDGSLRIVDLALVEEWLGAVRSFFAWLREVDALNTHD
jgi:hypothetical protein